MADEQCVDGVCVEWMGCEDTTTMGCESCACEDCVCEFFPECCAVRWDAHCVHRCGLCGGCGVIPPEQCADETCPDIEWVTMQPGSFLMGNDKYEPTRDPEKPVHEVTVPEFEIARTEVTLAQYNKCVEAGYCLEPNIGGYCHWGKGMNERQPVNCVSWFQAKTFCEWAGLRLPSEAEWEYAARSGGKDVEYPWGHQDPTCHYTVFHPDGEEGQRGCASDDTRPVCSMPLGATEQGLCDMAGNVFEWVEDDWHDSYERAPSDGSAWYSRYLRGSMRVLRGGCWLSDLDEALRVSYRGGATPYFRQDNFGFRPVRGDPAGDADTDVDTDTDTDTEMQCKGEECPAIDWVHIAGGSFEMGSNDADAYPDEQPVHGVDVPDFELAKAEATVSDYRKCVDAGACTEPGGTGDCNWGVAGRDDHPVNCLSWYQAREFSTWVGGRLPSEAEWEYAARSCGRDQRYPWGDQVATCKYATMDQDEDPDNGNEGCGVNSTWPACSLPAGNTAQGLCDMAGNVCEWVEDDMHSDYIGAPEDGSPWVDDQRPPARVERGGSWLHGPLGCRTTYRNFWGPSDKMFHLGVRPARSVK